MHDGIIDNSNSKKVSGFNLRVDVENPLKNNYSIDSPLLERMKEEQDIKSISSFKKVNSQSRTQFELKSPSKNDYYGPNLYTSNILVKI